jgi:hypothetical protein
MADGRPVQPGVTLEGGDLTFSCHQLIMAWKGNEGPAWHTLHVWADACDCRNNFGLLCEHLLWARGYHLRLRRPKVWADRELASYMTMDMLADPAVVAPTEPAATARATDDIVDEALPLEEELGTVAELLQQVDGFAVLLHERLRVRQGLLEGIAAGRHLAEPVAARRQLRDAVASIGAAWRLLPADPRPAPQRAGGRGRLDRAATSRLEVAERNAVLVPLAYPAGDRYNTAVMSLAAAAAGVTAAGGATTGVAVTADSADASAAGVAAMGESVAFGTSLDTAITSVHGLRTGFVSAAAPWWSSTASANTTTEAPQQSQYTRMWATAPVTAPRAGRMGGENTGSQALGLARMNANTTALSTTIHQLQVGARAQAEASAAQIAAAATARAASDVAVDVVGTFARPATPAHELAWPLLRASGDAAPERAATPWTGLLSGAHPVATPPWMTGAASYRGGAVAMPSPVHLPWLADSAEEVTTARATVDSLTPDPAIVDPPGTSSARAVPIAHVLSCASASQVADGGRTVPNGDVLMRECV